MKKQTLFWIVGAILFGVMLFFMGRLYGGGPSPQRPPVYSLSPGPTGMLGSGAGYLYDFSASAALPLEEVVEEIQRYLERQDKPDLALARLREFTLAYQAAVVEHSTGRYAFGLMVSKGTARISPKADPNLFWNTKYGPMIAEVGGGYGMLGRLLPKASVGEMSLTESEARGIAEETVKELGADLELTDEIAVFYGFYELYVLQDQETVGELDVNGYKGTCILAMVTPRCPVGGCSRARPGSPSQ